MGMGGTTARWCTSSRCPHLAQPLITLLLLESAKPAQTRPKCADGGFGGVGRGWACIHASPKPPKVCQWGFWRGWEGLGMHRERINYSTTRISQASPNAPKVCRWGFWRGWECADGSFGGVGRGWACIGDELNYSITTRTSQAIPNSPKVCRWGFGGVGRGWACIGNELNYSTSTRISQASPKPPKVCRWGFWRGWEGLGMHWERIKLLY